MVLGRSGGDRAQRQPRDPHRRLHDGKWKNLEGCMPSTIRVLPISRLWRRSSASRSTTRCRCNNAATLVLKACAGARGFPWSLHPEVLGALKLHLGPMGRQMGSREPGGRNDQAVDLRVLCDAAGIDRAFRSRGVAAPFQRLSRPWTSAEAAGFEGIFFSEHHFGASYSPSPNLLIAAVAVRTKKLRLGVMGMVPPLSFAVAAGRRDRDARSFDRRPPRDRHLCRHSSRNGANRT